MLILHTEVIQLETLIEIEEMCERITERLNHYKAKNGDFSYSIEPNYDTKEVVIKSCILNEEVN